MKRYDIEVQIVREEGIEAAIAEMVTVSDLHAWALKHKATVEGIPCQVAKRGELTYECDATNPCDACVARENALREIEELL